MQFISKFSNEYYLLTGYNSIFNSQVFSIFITAQGSLQMSLHPHVLRWLIIISQYYTFESHV